MEEIYQNLKEMKKKAAFSVGGLLLSIVLTAVLFITMGPIGLIGIVPVVISCIFTFKTIQKYTAYFKENVVRSALGEVFEEMTFSPSNGISSETVYSTGMIRQGDRFSSNDLIEGTYHGVRFTQSDIHIEEESTDSDGDTTTSTVFRGRWLIFEFNKNFEYDLQLVSKGFYASRRKDSIFSKKEDRFSRVKFENEEFNKEFHVLAKNEQEAFYILTPHMMEALLRLRQGLKAPVMLMFVGGVLHAAVQNNKDAFETKIFGKLDPEQEKQRILEEIGVITDFVDEMSLDRDIF